MANADRTPDLLSFRIALKLKTPNQRAVFCYIYEHPDCSVQDIRERTGVRKDNCLHIIRDLRARDLLIYRQDEVRKVRHYSVNEELVEGLLADFRKKLYTLFFG